MVTPWWPRSLTSWDWFGEKGGMSFVTITFIGVMLLVPEVEVVPTPTPRPRYSCNSTGSVVIIPPSPEDRNSTDAIDPLQHLMGCRKINSTWVTLDEIRQSFGNIRTSTEQGRSVIQEGRKFEDDLQEPEKDFWVTWSRKAPFCVRDHVDQTKQPGLVRFFPIFKKVEEKEKLAPLASLPVWIPHSSNAVFNYGLKRISLLRLETNDAGGFNYLRQWFHIKIVFDKRIPMEGLLIQPISGPLGVPFGEFRNDFNCQDVKDKETGLVLDLKKAYGDIVLIPCMYRPKSATRHPYVFVAGGSEASGTKSWTEFHVHFNWVDTDCADAPVMQFLFLAVKNFQSMDYLAFESPVYEHVEKDSGDGVPYPLYVAWENQVTCDKYEIEPTTQFRPPKRKRRSYDRFEEDEEPDEPAYNYNNTIWERNSRDMENSSFGPNIDQLPEGLVGMKNVKHSRKIRQTQPEECKTGTTPEAIKNTRDKCMQSQFTPLLGGEIIYNKDYDDCILGLGGKREGNRCPPGQFSCKMPNEVKRQDVVELTARCDRCPFEPDETTLKWEELTTEGSITSTGRPMNGSKPTVQVEIEMTAESHLQASKRFHGLLMILCWFVIIPGANFISRFYKETGKADGTGCCVCFGIPAWLISHIFLSFVGMILMWVALFISSGFPKGGSVDCEELDKSSKTSSHTEDCKSFRGTPVVHGLIGLLAILVYHKQLIDGWIRPSGLKKRGCITMIHCIGGYASYILAGIAALITGSCLDIKLEVIALMTVTIIMFVIGCVVQCVQDRRLSLTRKCFPVYDVYSVPEKPPLELVKFILLIVHWILHILLVGLVIVSYRTIAANNIPGIKDATTYTFKGLLWECKSLSANYLRLQIRCHHDPDSSTTMREECRVLSTTTI